MPKNQETFIYFTKLQMPLGLSRSCIQDFRLQNVSKDFDRNTVLVPFFLKKKVNVRRSEKQGDLITFKC